jgi:T5SS/PEP-CTERM-associated repeat protein
MKKNRLAIVALSVLSLPATAAHASKFWKNSVVAGNWSTGNNWSAVSPAGADNGGAPVGGEAVNIVHTDGTARTVMLDGLTPSLGVLSIDLTGAGVATDTLSITSSNNLTAAVLDVGGYNGAAFTNGRGAVVQSAGTTTVSPGGDLILGVGTGSTGTYTLSGGAVVANQSEFVGLNGAGAFNHSAGTNTLNVNAFGSFYVGFNAGSTGTYNLSGVGALASNEQVYIGHSGTGVFNQTGGTHNVSGGSVVGGFLVPHSLYLGYNANSLGTYTLSGGSLSINHGGLGIGYRAAGNAAQKGGTFIQSGGAISVAQSISIGSEGTGKYEHTGGTAYSNQDAYIGEFSTGVGELIVDGPTTIFSTRLYIAVGYFGVGSLVISNGGTVTTGDTQQFAATGYVGFDGNSSGYVVVRDPGSTWNINDTLRVGKGTVDIQNQGLVYVKDELIINSTGVVDLFGGKLRFNSVSDSGLSQLNFVAGTIQLGGARTIGGPTGDAVVATLFGAAPVIPAGKELAIEQTATLNRTLAIDGGAFTAPQIVNASALDLRRGTFNLTNQAVAIGFGGLFGGALDVNEGVTVNVTLGVTNQGLVTGDGQIGGTFVNTAAGELRAEPGRSLTLTGAGNTNAGQINLYGGMLDFTQNLTNNAGAFISGNGSLIVGGGLVNQGTMNFAGTANIVGDVTNSATGKIISGGGGATIFFDDVTNNGEIRTSTNGFTVFFGSVSGGGTFSGTGTVNFEGDLSPGNSPATVQFAGDVVLGPDALLQIELGGTTPGSRYDQINVAGELTLGGTLEILLINGFTPAAGQTFDFLNAGTLAGAFSSVVLPDLPGLAWDASQLAAGTVSVTFPADFNGDGNVNSADLVNWKAGFGTSTGAAHSQGDADNDHDSDGADFLAWQRQFNGAPPALATADPVPEPAALLLALATLALTPSRMQNPHRLAIVSRRHPRPFAQFAAKVYESA